MAANKAKAKVEELKKVRGVSKGTGGKTEYLKDVSMKYSQARVKRSETIRALNKAKATQKF